MVKKVLNSIFPHKQKVMVSNHGYVRMVDGKSIGIVSKTHWEKYGRLNSAVDVKVHMLLRSLGFVELSPAVYEYAGSGKVKDEDVLKDAGFVRLHHDE